MLEDVLKEWGGREVSDMDVYTDIFKLGEGYIQKDGEPSGSFKANPVAYYRCKGQEKGHYRIMFEDTFEDTLRELQEADDFAILNGLTYFGRRNLQEHASKMFAMIFDLDGVTDKTLDAFLSGAFRADAYPIPNYIALSGHGCHLYYVFEEPLDLYPYLKIQLKELKYALTERMWNAYTSTEEKCQHQGINQGFRVLGGRTKPGAPESKVRPFQLNTHPFSLEQLCKYVPEDKRVDEKKLWKERKYTLEQAKKKFPEWYEKVVVNGDTSRTYWDIAGKVHGDNPFALYDWWKRKIYEGASFHHRYFSIMCLAIYGAKCDKPYEEVEKDAYDFVPFLNSLNPKEPFTEQDCDVALECYDARYKTFPIKDIWKISGIDFQKNKRNHRRQKLHLKIARNTLATLNEDRGEALQGRPKASGTAEQKVAAYRAEHSDASVTEVAKALGISRTTVYKWWDAPLPEPERDEELLQIIKEMQELENNPEEFYKMLDKSLSEAIEKSEMKDYIIRT